MIQDMPLFAPSTGLCILFSSSPGPEKESPVKERVMTWRLIVLVASVNVGVPATFQQRLLKSTILVSSAHCVLNSRLKASTCPLTISTWRSNRQLKLSHVLPELNSLYLFPPLNSPFPQAPNFSKWSKLLVVEPPARACLEGIYFEK